MTEILFYHLERDPLEQVLPKLLERTLDRGWKAVVQAGSRERLDALDAHLWTYADDSFLPHASDGEGDLGEEVIVLTTGSGNPNGAEVRFLVDGAPLPDEAGAYQRLVLMFDGGDDEAVGAARESWRTLRTSGHELTYWQQSESGRWEKKG